MRQRNRTGWEVTGLIVPGQDLNRETRSYSPRIPKTTDMGTHGPYARTIRTDRRWVAGGWVAGRLPMACGEGHPCVRIGDCLLGGLFNGDAGILNEESLQVR
jgi:hypothetical protein